MVFADCSFKAVYIFFTNMKHSAIYDIALLLTIFNIDIATDMRKCGHIIKHVGIKKFKLFLIYYAYCVWGLTFTFLVEV